MGHEEIAGLRVKQARIQQRISKHIFHSQTTSQNWNTSDDEREIDERTEAVILHCQLVKKHAQLFGRALSGSDVQFSPIGGAFVRLYPSSSTGLKSGVSNIVKDHNIRYNARRTLIETYNGTMSYMRSRLWCPITTRWVEQEAARTAYIFGYANGKDTMDAIFGRRSTSPELFSPLNGMVMSAGAEARFNKGLFVIVPALDEGAISEQIQEWHDTEDKPYKIRIVAPDAASMQNTIQSGLYYGKKWKELDGQPVEFRNEARPRAQYLYFHFVCSMLRRAWNGRRKEKRLLDQFGKKFWTIPGPYMRSAMLRAFAVEVGYEFDGLLDGGVEEGEEEDGMAIDDTALIAAIQQIIASIDRHASMLYDESESDTSTER